MSEMSMYYEPDYSSMEGIGISSFPEDNYKFDVGSFVSDLTEGLSFTGASSDVTSPYALTLPTSGGVKLSADGGTGVAPGLTTAAFSGGSSSGGDWMDLLTSFVKGNSSDLLKLVAGGISGAASASGLKEAAAIKVQGDKELLAEADRLKQEAQKRYSASITGMKPLVQNTFSPLKRSDGTLVYGSGLINGGK